MCQSLGVSYMQPGTKHIVGHTHILIKWAEMFKIWKGTLRGGGEEENSANINHSTVQFGQDFVSIFCETLDLNFNALKA